MAGMNAFERETLANGLRLLTAPMPHAQSVACVIMLAAGSRYERRETNGIAHFAEHMFFKGTERRPTARDIALEAGLVDNKSCSIDDDWQAVRFVYRLADRKRT